jgi:hypothetical protein
MALGEAKAKAKREFAEVLEGLPYSLEELRAYVPQNPELKRPMYQFPRETPKVVGTAAHFAIHLAERMQAAGIRPPRRRSPSRRAVTEGARAANLAWPAQRLASRQWPRPQERPCRNSST